MRKILAIVAVIGLSISLVPMLWVSRYNHPTGDDIYYGLEAHQAWEETGSVLKTVQAAVEGVQSDYYRWQGTFSALLIMRLQPTVFNEGLYFLTPFIILSLFLLGYLYAVKSVAKYILPMDKWDTMALWATLCFVSIQWMHVVGDGFYWFNGGVYYTGFHGLMMLSVGLVIRYIYTGRKRILIPLFLLAIGIGGSNYITLLTSLLLLGLTIVYLLWKKKKGRWGLLAVEMVMLLCFIISAMAPGNANRQAVSSSMAAYKAVIFSLLQGFSYLDAWGTVWWFLGMLFLLPFATRVISKSNFSFKWPLAVIVLCYGLFCAMQCPTMYAESSTGQGRVINVIYYGFILYSYTATFYVWGWVCKKLKLADEVDRYSLWRSWCVVFVIVLTFACGIGIRNDSIKNMTSVKAFSDITSGRGDAYHQEYVERLEMLQRSDVQDVVFRNFESKPKVLYVGDFAPDPTIESNQKLAAWYGKQSVTVLYE